MPTRLPSIRKSDTQATGVQPLHRNERIAANRAAASRMAANMEALQDALREEEAERNQWPPAPEPGRVVSEAWYPEDKKRPVPKWVGGER